MRLHYCSLMIFIIVYINKTFITFTVNSLKYITQTKYKRPYFLYLYAFEQILWQLRAHVAQRRKKNYRNLLLPVSSRVFPRVFLTGQSEETQKNAGRKYFMSTRTLFKQKLIKGCKSCLDHES